ncbi:zinc finger MYM-type protein 1-like [Ornithodoros turicata]|uniref:zinc finger MYM-type protein 1-like n=1 Tax=Ornithodoros turicata TaxID=34597 RepID=UPI003139EBDC
MKQSRQALLAVLSSGRFLARQGLSLRGHDEDEGNLRQLLMLREADVAGLGAWLNKRADILLPQVQEGLEVEEVFIGFYVTADTRASTLFSILKDVLCRLNLQIENCRGQCYDGAANVSGKSGGLQALVQDIEPRAMYVHCLAHTLNLVLQDLCKQIDVCRDFVSLFADLVNFLKTSPKRLSWFEQFQKEGTPALRQFCKTRWTLKASSLRSVSSNYSELVQFLFALSSDEKNDTGAKASGYAKALGKFDSYFMLRLMILVFERLESANSALQKKSLQFGHAEQIVKAVKECVAELRDKFPGFWSTVKATAEELKTGSPSLPIRQRQAPRRYDEGSQAHEFRSSEAYYRQRFYMVIDTVHASLCTRFPAGMWDHVTKVEKFLMGETDSAYLCEFYK